MWIYKPQVSYINLLHKQLFIDKKVIKNACVWNMLQLLTNKCNETDIDFDSFFLMFKKNELNSFVTSNYTAICKLYTLHAGYISATLSSVVETKSFFECENFSQVWT